MPSRKGEPEPQTVWMRRLRRKTAIASLAGQRSLQRVNPAGSKDQSSGDKLFWDTPEKVGLQLRWQWDTADEFERGDTRDCSGVAMQAAVGHGSGTQRDCSGTAAGHGSADRVG